jgi:hypothetical protein
MYMYIIDILRIFYILYYIMFVTILNPLGLDCEAQRFAGTVLMLSNTTQLRSLRRPYCRIDLKWYIHSSRIKDE